MAKKLFGLSMFLWILIALAILFFVYGGVDNKENFLPRDMRKITSALEYEGKHTRSSAKDGTITPNYRP